MALSLAINWSPPPSSPLLDETTLSPESMSAVSSESNNQAAARRNFPAGSSTSASLSTSSTNSSSQPAAAAPNGNLTKGRSYAAAAKPSTANANASAAAPAPARSVSAPAPPQQHGHRTMPQQAPVPNVPQLPPFASFQSQQPSFHGALTYGVPPQMAFPPQNGGMSQNQFSWMQYQQMLNAQQYHQQQQQQGAHFKGQDDPNRKRATSGPQRPAPLTYNDTFAQQAYPGPHTFATMLKNNLQAPSPSAYSPALGAPSPSQSHASSSSSASNQAFHPYRRTARGSDAGPAPFPVSSQHDDPQGLSRPVRARTASSASPSTGSDALLSNQGRKGSSNHVNNGSTSPSDLASAGLPRGAPVGNYGHAYSKSLPGMPQQAVARGPGGPALALNGSMQQPAAPNTNGFKVERKSPPSLAHSREDSFSSQGSHFSTAGGSMSSSHTSQHGSGSGSGSGSGGNGGRTTPTPAIKKPSPLSRDQPDNQSIATTISPSSTQQQQQERDDKKKGSLSGKLRKALSFSALDDISNTQGVQAAPNGRQLPARILQQQQMQQPGISTSSQDSKEGTGSTRSSSPPRTPDNGQVGSSGASITSKKSSRPPVVSEGRRSLFNRKFNSSTDNISVSSKLSISSTVSSASMMLRKVGGLGKFAKRSNLMGITNMFNKDKDRDVEDKFGPITDGGKGDKKSKKKGAVPTTSISHATAENDAAAAPEGGMTPAAHYVRQMQEAEARAEAAARAQREAEAAKLKKGAKTMEDVQGARQKMLEKEKATLKSKRAGGWRKKIGLGSSGDAQELTGLETLPVGEEAQDDSNDGPYGPYAATAVGMPPPGAFVQEDEAAFDAAFENEELEPPRIHGSGAGDSGDEFETDSLRHWGEGIELARASAAKVKAPRGILKRSMSEQVLSEIDRPWMRTRANSYDTPNGPSPASAPLMSQMSNTTGGANRMDGVAGPASPHAATPAKGHQRSETMGAAIPSPSPVMGHHTNSSMPTLSLMTDPANTSASQKTLTALNQRKRLTFAESHIFHSTWPANVYDRRGDLATCNRLTPLLAQQIKEELNTYKMEEMQVAPSSRIHTHFFV